MKMGIATRDWALLGGTGNQKPIERSHRPPHCAVVVWPTD